MKDTKKRKNKIDLLREHRDVFTISPNAAKNKKNGSSHFFREFKKGGIRAVIRKPNISVSRLKNRLQFNALELRDEIFSSGIITRKEETGTVADVVIGLPATLNMLEYLPLWELFFKRLGFTAISSTTMKPYIKFGKEISNAEYCSPLTDFHGHIKELANTTDYIFYPQIFENVQGDEKRSYCYYCHYAVPILKNIPDFEGGKKLISPLLTINEQVDELIRALFLSLPDSLKRIFPRKNLRKPAKR
ncbi:MAG: acyl-CoA dehydratase activase-related protein [Nitrospinota bacterium]